MASKKIEGTRTGSTNRPLPARWVEKVQAIPASLDFERLMADKKTRDLKSIKPMAEAYDAFNKAFVAFMRDIPADFAFSAVAVAPASASFPVGSTVRVKEAYLIIYPLVKKGQKMKVTAIKVLGEGDAPRRYFIVTDVNVAFPLGHLERAE